jgi:hypothetical protein
MSSKINPWKSISATQLTAANPINIQLLNPSTSPRSTDMPHDDRLSGQQYLDVANRFIIILDENFEDKTWNQHQEDFVFRKVVANSVAHARYKTFLTKYHVLQRELIPGVHVTTRFASYSDWRAAPLVDAYHGSRMRQLVLDHAKHLIINFTHKHMAANHLDLSNKIACAFNLLPHADNFNDLGVGSMVVHTLTDSVK